MTQTLHAHINKRKKKDSMSLALVTEACNASYSGGRDKEDNGLKPAPGK
jgi:hypothetical protein